MKRRYRVAGFLRRVDEIHQRLDQPALTTDVIVGFPGESERDFCETLRGCESGGFSKIHIFPFSPRQGTMAARLTSRVDVSIIRERKCRLQALESQLAERYHQSLIGRKLQVLVERVPRAVAGPGRGTACRYVPVEFSARPDDEFQLINLVVTGARSCHVIGRRTGAQPSKVDWSLPVLNGVVDCGTDENSKGANDV
jgi:threonylcarbamoyladenosine tRNA methylthiotransferase MtaB